MMRGPTPRVVFDCGVFLQGAARPAGPAAACLDLVDEGAVVLCLSAEVLVEWRDVPLRPSLRRKFPILTPSWVDELLERLLRRAEMFEDVPAVFFYPRDPKDERYVNLAVAAGARYIVSRDNDLLDLMKPGDAAGKAFRSRFPDLTILDPAAFLRVVTLAE